MVTAEEIITELQKMLPETDGLYARRLQEVIERLQQGKYSFDLTLPSDELIYELRAIGFPDLAKKLTWKGGEYGR